jgi:TolB protein
MSADGRRLGFAGLSTSSQLWAQHVSPDGSPKGDAVALTRDTSRRNSLPSISPDGSKIAYMSLRRGELPNVWLMDIDGRNALQLTSDETAEHQPKWFPDGQRIAYPSNRGNVRGVWSVSITTRREELLFDMARTREVPRAAAPLNGRLAELDLAPSMSQAAFSLVAPPLGRRLLYVAGIDPFAPRALTDGTQSVGYPAWSRDERYIAVEVKDGSSTHAAIIDVQSGAMRRLTNERGQTWVRSWSPDGRKVAAAALRQGVWSLRAIDVETGLHMTISPPLGPGVFVRYPEWSPLGKAVVYERGETHGNIWMLTVN